MRVWNLFAILFPVMVFSSFRVPISPRMLLLLLLSHRMDVVFCKHLDELAFCNGIVQVSKDVNPCLLHSWNLLGSKLPLFPVRGWSSRFISFTYTVYIYLHIPFFRIHVIFSGGMSLLPLGIPGVYPSILGSNDSQVQPELVFQIASGKPKRGMERCVILGCPRMPRDEKMGYFTYTNTKYL